MVSEDNEWETLHKSAAKKKLTQKIDRDETITVQIEWQLKDQIVSLWYIMDEEQQSRPSMQNNITDWCIGSL